MFSGTVGGGGIKRRTLALITTAGSTAQQGVLNQLLPAIKGQVHVHTTYTYTILENDDLLNIYTCEDLSSLASTRESVDLSILLLDYEGEPRTWLKDLRKLSRSRGQKLVLVLNRSKSEHKLSQDTHDCIQLALRGICLKEGYALLYCSEVPNITKVASSLLFGHGVQMEERNDFREFYIASGSDSWGKIAALDGSVSSSELRKEVDTWEDPQGRFVKHFENRVPVKLERGLDGPHKKELGNFEEPPTYREFLKSISN